MKIKIRFNLLNSSLLTQFSQSMLQQQMKKIIVFSILYIFALGEIANISIGYQDVQSIYNYAQIDNSEQLEQNQLNDYGKGNGKGNSKGKGNMKQKNNGKGNEQIIEGEDSTYNDSVNPSGKVKGWAKKNLKIQQGLQSGDMSYGMNPAGKFKGWMKKYLRNYQPEQYEIRLSYFQRNLQVIERHNTERLSLYQMEANKFADLSDEQFLLLYLMIQAPNIEITMTAPVPQQEYLAQSPQYDSGDQGQSNGRLLQTLSTATVDWRKRITFAPIKDQGKCAACYAFADIAVVQLHKALKLSTRRQPILSEQQILDCCKTAGYRCNGCSSGNLGSTLDFLADKGIATAQSYPYTSIVSSTCRLGRVRTSSFLNTQMPYYQMFGQRNTVYYLVNSGPLAVAADGTTWKFYKNGTFDGCPMTKFNYTHAIALIGVDKDNWSIRNSWGSDWGQNGYIKIKRGGNPCGILNYVFLPQVV